MFDGKIIIPIKSLIWIHPLHLKKKTLVGCYRATLGGIQEIECLCTKVDFGHVGIVQKRKMDEKTHVLGQKMRKPLMTVKVYHFIVTNYC